MKRFLAAVIVLNALAASAFAWGEKGHTVTTDAATLALPTDIPQFFYRDFPTLTYLGDEPDRWRSGGETLNAENEPNHFIDYEYVAGLNLPRDRYQYVALLVSSGTLRKHGVAVSAPGFLPWRIAELTEQLTQEWRIWRGTRAGSPERAQAEREIVTTAGLLSHFVGDASNPLHATVHFNGWADADNPQNFSNDCDVHSRFETAFINHAIETADVVPLIAPPLLRADPFLTAAAFVRESNALVGTLYRIDRDGGFTKITPEAKEFTAKRLAAGSSLLRDLWWSAWRNSATRARRPATPAE